MIPDPTPEEDPWLPALPPLEVAPLLSVAAARATQMRLERRLAILRAGARLQGKEGKSGASVTAL